MAKTVSKAIDAGRDLGGFLGKIFGPAANEIGQTAADWCRYFRCRNLIAIEDLMEKIRQRRKIAGPTRPIAPKHGIPLIERASLEDDPKLQEMWAALLANATDPSKDFELKRVFADVLASLEPLDTAILKHISSQGWLMHRKSVPGGGIYLKMLISQFSSAPENDIRVSLQNLNRLGLLGDEHVVAEGLTLYSPESPQIGSTSFGLKVSEVNTTFRPTPLGFELLKACEP